MLVAVSLAGCNCGYVRYSPVQISLVEGEPALVEAPELLNEEHLMAMQLVLFNYGEPFKVRHGQIFIERNLHDDTELLANYTEKAERLSEGIRMILMTPQYNSIGWSAPVPERVK
jgi:hypothetical protein